MKYNAGDKVKLAPFEETGQPEQTGTIVLVDHPSGTYMIALDGEFITEKEDDGFRDVPEDQVIELISKGTVITEFSCGSFLSWWRKALL